MNMEAPGSAHQAAQYNAPAAAENTATTEKKETKSNSRVGKFLSYTAKQLKKAPGKLMDLIESPTRSSVPREKSAQFYKIVEKTDITRDQGAPVMKGQKVFSPNIS